MPNILIWFFIFHLGDDQDMSIPVALPVSVVAAIGPLNSEKEVAFHTHHYNKGIFVLIYWMPK